jgi:hypothetical protein
MNEIESFTLPDRFIGGVIDRFRFSPEAGPEAHAVLAKSPRELLISLLKDQEGEACRLAALRVIGATVEAASEEAARQDRPAPVDSDGLLARIRALRDHVAATVSQALSHGAAARRVMMRERAAIALLDACWLDAVSQPATQPAIIANRLFTHYWRLKGEGNPARSRAALRRRRLEQEGIFLPALNDVGFPREAEPTAATALQAAFLVSLGRYPVSHLPEIVGVHFALHALGLDQVLFDAGEDADAAEAGELLDAYLELAAKDQASAIASRVFAAADMMARLEVTQAEMLAGMAERRAAQTLDAEVADILGRYAPYAGSQHGRVRLGGAPLVDLLSAPVLDLADLVGRLKRSGYTRPNAQGRVRFLEALKFGGPMFGIFSAEEADVLAAWARRIPETIQDEVIITTVRPDQTQALAWLERIRGEMPKGVAFEACPALDDRDLLYRLVNFESFPHVLEQARSRARLGLDHAQRLFRTGAAGRYTDATWFDYTPEALFARVSDIYWQKLVNPYKPLQEIPPRDEVIFGQKVFALGSMVDGSWAFRIGKVGHYELASDGTLFSIYADEMGLGDVRKNHITLIYQVLESLGIRVPHLRDAAFLEQDEIPDQFYPFALNQLSLGLFPDSFYPEIIGYNLGIEMFGLGEMRLHEIQKLKHWGFDPIYEETHLSIDNVSGGHARDAADIIVAHLDHVERRFGPTRVEEEWRRIWNGYASFALFMEGPRLLEASDGLAAASDDHVELTI